MSDYSKFYKSEDLVDDVSDARVDKGIIKNLEILKQLWENPDGLTTSELCKNTGYNRDRVNRAVQRLKGLITKESRKGKYQLTDNSKLNSMIFGMDATRELVNDMSSSLFVKNSILTNLTLAIAIQEQLFFSNIKKGKNLTKESENLLDFAIKIGSLITFIMLKAVKPSENEDINGRKKEKQALTWVRNSILPSVILYEFMKLDIVKKGKRIKKSRENTITKNMNANTPLFMKKEFQSRLISDELYSPYEIDKKTYQNLEKAFTQIWPFTHVILKELSKTQRLTEKRKNGIATAHETTVTISKIKENRENLLCFKSQQIVKIISLAHLERLNKIY